MPRHWLAIFLRAGIPGLLIALAFASQGQVSVQIWTASAGAWIAGTLLWDFVGAARVGPERRWAALQISNREAAHGSIDAPGSVRTLSLLLANAQTNPLIHANVLRPRLLALADHFVPIRHGFDRKRDPERLTSLLGDVAWLVDSSVMNRMPTPAEIGRFLGIVLAEEDEPLSVQRDAPQVPTT